MVEYRVANVDNKCIVKGDICEIHVDLEAHREKLLMCSYCRAMIFLRKEDSWQLKLNKLTQNMFSKVRDEPLNFDEQICLQQLKYPVGDEGKGGGFTIKFYKSVIGDLVEQTQTKSFWITAIDVMAVIVRDFYKLMSKVAGEAAFQDCCNLLQLSEKFDGTLFRHACNNLIQCAKDSLPKKKLKTLTSLQKQASLNQHRVIKKKGEFSQVEMR